LTLLACKLIPLKLVEFINTDTGGLAGIGMILGAGRSVFRSVWLSTSAFGGNLALRFGVLFYSFLRWNMLNTYLLYI
jgi:hypothetical protein